jgi:hypothetical protein
MQIAIVSALRQIAGIEAAREDEKGEKELHRVKKKFIKEFSKHELLRRIGPEAIWNDLQKHLRKEYLRRTKAAVDDTEQRLQEIKREFIESIKRSLSLSNLEAEKLWGSIRDDVRREMMQHPGEWRSE